MEIIQNIISENNYSLTSFEYLMIPKFTLQIPIDDTIDIEEIVYNSKKSTQETLEKVNTFNSFLF